MPTSAYVRFSRQRQSNSVGLVAAEASGDAQEPRQTVDSGGPGERGRRGGSETSPGHARPRQRAGTTVPPRHDAGLRFRLANSSARVVALPGLRPGGCQQGAGPDLGAGAGRRPLRAEHSGRFPGGQTQGPGARRRPGGRLPPAYRRLQPLPVHRLDQYTSGVFCMATNPAARQHLIEQLKAHTMRREYVAYVEGRPTAPKAPGGNGCN